MAGPEYDFFATGPRQAPQPSAAPTGRTVSAAAPSAPMAPAPSGAVNQFGLPVDEYAPTGPYAAPGYGTAPVAHGLVASQDPAWPAQPGRRQAAPPADVRPGTVVAAGVISIVLGALSALFAGLGLLGYLAMSAQLDELAAQAGSDSATAAAFGSAILGVVLIGVVVLAVFAALYLVLGIMTVRGRRPFAWALLVVSALNLLWSAYQYVNGSMGGAGSTGGTFGTMIGFGVVVAIVLLLTVGSGGAWLRRS